ncbi:MAG: hypothetical protein ACYTHM_15230 [Planctomycetota bacterium]|jgi:hypothetical protein
MKTVSRSSPRSAIRGLLLLSAFVPLFLVFLLPLACDSASVSGGEKPQEVPKGAGIPEEANPRLETATFALG